MIRLAVGGVLAAVVVGCQAPAEQVDPSATTLPARTEAPTPTTGTDAAPATTSAVDFPPAPSNVEVAPVEIDPVLAVIDGVEVRRSMVVDRLMQSRGLDMLLRVLQLEMARADAQSRGIVLTSDDFEQETLRTLRMAFGPQDETDLLNARTDEERAAVLAGLAGEREQMISQFVASQNQTRVDFDMLMQTNAYLRAMIMPAVKEAASDEALRNAFNVIHGEKVVTRHIALANLQEVAEAQRRLAAGEAFEQVAREMSRVPRTAAVGGELPPFTRTATDISPAFVETAFGLEPGQVSDPVQYEGLYHLIRLDEKIAPTAVKFEDVKESVRTELENSMSTEAIRALRQQYAVRVLQALDIRDPMLKEEFEARREAAQPKPTDRQRVLEQLPLEREPTTTPTTAPTTAPATTP